MPAAGGGPGPPGLSAEGSRGTGAEGVLGTVSFDEPPLPSPSEIFAGVTEAGVVTASTICARPAPWRQVGSRPAPGAMFTPLGNAVFISKVWTIAGELLLCFAWSSSAASPATWGEDIEVPLIVLWPPNC